MQEGEQKIIFYKRFLANKFILVKIEYNEKIIKEGWVSHLTTNKRCVFVSDFVVAELLMLFMDTALTCLGNPFTKGNKLISHIIFLNEKSSILIE